MFRLVDDSSPGVVAQGAPLLVGLFVTACFVWWLRPVPPSAAFSWSGLASSATGHVLFASIMAAVAVVSIARLAPDKGKRNAGPLAFYTAACAVWLTPLAVLLSEASLWAVIPAAFLALGLVTTFRSYRNAPGRVPALELVEETGTPALFHVTSLRQAEEWRAASLSASILLQAALVTVLIDSPIGAAAFTLSGGAVLMWNSMRESASGEPPPTFSSKVVARALGMTVLAIVLTAAGLLRYLASESWPGQLEGQSDLVAMAKALFGPAPFDSEPDTSSAEAGDDDPGEKDRGDTALQVAVSDQSFPGIILLPDEQPFMKVVPFPPALKDGFHQGVDRDPLAIPFEGVYWYLLWPIARPPANAVVTRGSPSVRTFRATDLSRLSMQARHNFGSLLEVSCCRAIEVHITNADRFPGTVSLELVLVNTTLPESPSQSLGRAAVDSAPRLEDGGGILAVREVLVYPMPRNSKLQQFDEVALTFRPHPRRHELSARMAIDRFILIPRGS